MSSILSVMAYTSMFAITDRVITTVVKKPYYLLHSLHNAAIVYLTFTDVINTVTDFQNIHQYPTNMAAIYICFALHFYHIILYYKEFRFDDWLHHILMIGLALPVPLLIETHTLTGYSLFFTTGLPGGIDYAMLFLVRNNLLERNVEKRVNAWLNTWIRSPGCISQAILSITYIFMKNQQYSSFEFAIQWLPILLVFWNGQYFMRQIVEDSYRGGLTT